MSVLGRPRKKKGRSPHVGDVWLHENGWMWMILSVAGRPNLYGDTLRVITLMTPAVGNTNLYVGEICSASASWCQRAEYTRVT